MEFLNVIVAKSIRIPKRVRYVVASAVGAVLLFVAIGVPYPYSWLVLPLLCISSYGLIWFSLLEDIHGAEWYILFILPVAWTATWYISFYMVPMRFVIKILFSLTYPLILYIIASAMNIFNVGVEKNIQLRRAARAANQFIIVLVFYLFTQIMSSFGLSWHILGVATGVFSWILGIQLFWTLDPQETISVEVKSLALFQGFTTGFFMILLSFLPFVMDTPRPMIITGIFHVVNGVLSTYTDTILFKQRIREYFGISVILIIAILLTLQW